MDLLFATDSWWNWEAEKTYQLLKAQNPELVQAAQAGRGGVADAETRGGVGRGERALSLVPLEGGGEVEKREGSESD